MPEAIESKSFRSAARRNCIMYLGIPIYMASIPDMKKLELPTFRTQSPDGAVSQLLSTLVNMNTQIEQIRKGLRMSDSKPVPGVSYNEIGSLSMALNGDVYFESASQYASFEARIRTISTEYGWIENASSVGAAVYHPAKNNFTNTDPVQAAVKGLVMGAASEMMDAATLAYATDSITKGSESERKYFAARDRYEGGSIFDMTALQYYSNTPTTVQNAWSSELGDECVPVLLIDNAVAYKANISYMPTSMAITPGAYVADATGMYPTRCAISVQMANPLGGLFANFSLSKEGTAGAGDESKALTPPAYLKNRLY